jgi:hypothetical protein
MIKAIRYALLPLFFLSSLAVPTFSVAGQIIGKHPLLSDSISLRIGGFLANHSGEYLYNGRTLNGVQIDFQDDLGIADDQLLPSVSVRWRVTNASQLQFDYFSFSDTGISNYTGPFGQGLFSGLLRAEESLDIYRLFYGYNFLKEDAYEVGVGIGAHVAQLQASLEGAATVNGVPVANYKSEFDEWGLLPNLGVYGGYAFSEKLLATLRADWLSLSVDGVEGTLWNGAAALQYQLFDNLGVGLSYSYVDLEASEDKNTSDGWDAQLGFTGPSAFISINF